MSDECEVCGCTELQACLDPFDEEPHACYWIAPGLCSACRYTPLGFRAPELHERVPLYGWTLFEVA